MNKKTLNQWIMYHHIHYLSRLGFSAQKIARHVTLDARTVRRMLGMSEQQYEESLIRQSERSKILSPYEHFVKEKLTQFKDTSSAQMHDWLIEQHSELQQVKAKTVYNFVMYVRRKYNIPVETPLREYFPVAELPYGEQAQVDFGECNLRDAYGRRKKVKFFAMVLSRSRMKYIYFWEGSYTAQHVVEAHEKAFAFYGGVPKTIVYDQDRTLLVDENMGELMLTDTFRQYTKSSKFELHFCRRSDPESKGKIENVIGYTKKNFLYNRAYSDINTLNEEALAWLGRTANYHAHNFTKKSPQEEFSIEKEFLNPYTPMPVENRETKHYHVRKNNTIAYKGNFYTVPFGTYMNGARMVIVKEHGDTLEIYTLNEELICSHMRCYEKGKTITNTHHRRDTSISLDELMRKTASCFTDEELSTAYLQKIKAKFPRYTRDHWQAIVKAVADIPKPIVDKTLSFCIKNTLFNASEFEQVLHVILLQDIPPVKKQASIRLMDEDNLSKVNQAPQLRSLLEYENIINQ
jgi:transposase